MGNAAKTLTMTRVLVLIWILWAISCSQMHSLYGSKEDSEISWTHREALARVSQEQPILNLQAATFADCSEVQSYTRQRLVQQLDGQLMSVRAQREAEESRRKGQPHPLGYSNSAANMEVEALENDTAGSSESYTNVQEDGVDEGDYIKIGQHHLLALRGTTLHVSDRQKLVYLGKLDLQGKRNIQLYVDEHHLITVGLIDTMSESRDDPQNCGGILLSSSTTALPMGSHDSYCSQPNVIKTETQVTTYLLAAGAMPAEITSRTFPGSYQQHRMLDGHLVLTFADRLPLVESQVYAYSVPDGASADDYIAENPVLLEEDETYKSIPCSSITKPQVEDFDLRTTLIFSINTRDIDLKDQSLAVLGTGDHLYMTTKNIYLVKQGAHWHSYYSGNDSSFEQYLVVSKVRIADQSGEMEFAAVGAMVGRIKDQWALKEYAESSILSVATSTGRLWADLHSADVAQNHLFLLQENTETKVLDLVGSIRDFGTGEDIRAVRYIDQLAYVVTFKKTDPLFAFDLSDPANPKTLDALKIPGFSVYMHPIRGQQMIGVGFDAADQGDFAYYQGIQVSLFDISDPTELVRSDVKIHGGRGSYSEVTSDHHAFFYDQESDLMALPLVEIGANDVQSAAQIGNDLQFSGAILYDLSGGNLEEIARVSHRDLLPADCLNQLNGGRWWEDSGKSIDINRIFKVDDAILTLSQFGIKIHEVGNLQGPAKVIVFERMEQGC